MLIQETTDSVKKPSEGDIKKRTWNEWIQKNGKGFVIG
jgi:hypothetical protein